MNNGCEAQLSVLRQDKALKQALFEHTATNNSKQRVQFLLLDLHSINNKLINDLTRGHLHKDLIKNAIRFGYPVPLAVAVKLADVFNNFLLKSKIYSAGVKLQIVNNESRDSILKVNKIGKIKFELRNWADLHLSIGLSLVYWPFGSQRRKR
jgi:hypothetical protein